MSNKNCTGVPVDRALASQSTNSGYGTVSARCGVIFEAASQLIASEQAVLIYRTVSASLSCRLWLRTSSETNSGRALSTSSRQDKMTHWKQLHSQGVQSTKPLRSFCNSATHSRSTTCNDSVGPWMNVVARRYSQLAKKKRKQAEAQSNLLTSEGRPPINPVGIFWPHVRFKPADSQLRGALLMEGT